jgi:hypothetical protein
MVFVQKIQPRHCTTPTKAFRICNAKIKDGLNRQDADDTEIKQFSWRTPRLGGSDGFFLIAGG